MADAFFDIKLVLDLCHFAAAFRTFATRLDTVFHATDLFAACGAGFAYISANAANVLAKSRIAKHEITCGLAYLRTIDH